MNTPSSQRDTFDICILGAGPAGCDAALAGAKAGRRVAVVEPEAVGGVCLNAGCIPTKALLHAALAEGAVPDWKTLQAKKEAVVARLRRSSETALVKAGVDIVRGSASFAANLPGSETHRIRVCGAGGERTLSAPHVLLATGSRPVFPAGVPRGARIVDSTGALFWDELPQSLVVLGGGAVACEFATLFARLGVRVTLLETASGPLPGWDADISSFVARNLAFLGVGFVPQAEVVSAEESGDAVRVVCAEDRMFRADALLVCAGRSPNLEGLSLEAAGLAPGPHGGIPVDGWFRTAVPGLYAAGDVVDGAIRLAHWAYASAQTAMADILDARDEAPDLSVVPACVFTHPEVAMAGKTEQSLQKEGVRYEARKTFFRALGMAHAASATDGFAKILSDPATGRLLGVHIAGAHASTLIGEASLALHLGATEKDLRQTIHPHPSFSEILGNR